jgi:hypothetical protein
MFQASVFTYPPSPSLNKNGMSYCTEELRKNAASEEAAELICVTTHIFTVHEYILLSRM